MDLGIKKYKRIIKESIDAIEITRENVAFLNKMYRTEFNIGDFMIVQNENENDIPSNVVVLSPILWSRKSFIDAFEEI